MTETEPCRAVKHGRVSLTCELGRGHEGWHRAEYHDRQEITYQGARHVVNLTESVTWEPPGHIAEAVQHIAEAAEGTTP